MTRWSGNSGASRFADAARFAGRAFGRPPVRIAAVFALAVTFLVLLTLQETELRRERAEYNYLLTTNNWALSQLEYELERFLGALDRYMLGGPDMDRDLLSMRFDILWSRIPILLEGPETSEIRTIEGAVERLSLFAATLRAVEPDLAALLPGDRDRYQGIRTELSAHRLPIHDLTIEVYSGEHFQQLVARTRESNRRAAIYQVSMLTVVGLLAAFLGLEVVQSTRRARNEAAAREAAEAANLAKSNFLATMSHELRTPLNAIMGFAEVQKRQIFGPLPARYHSYAGDIHASAEHLLAVLTGILDMARMEGRRMAPDDEEFDPAEAVHAAVRMIDGERERNGLRVLVDVATVGITLRADRRMFRQIVLNLLSNAIKFTPAGGTIRVSVAGNAGGLLLGVEDTGIGIAPDVVDRVAEPFFQADQSHARRHQGTGLGLSLVKGFAELHDGSLTIESEPGCGTLATVRFPAGRVRRATPPAAAR